MKSRFDLLYSLLDKHYHESFDTYVPCKEDFYDLVSASLPKSWETSRKGIWFYCSSSNNIVPAQGWKIHISAMPANAREVLASVVETLFARRDTNFKFALDLSVLFLINSKNWSRGGSGKFLTIYPQDNSHFLDVIEQLHRATAGLHGPYILSDRRYKDSRVVFYRYGGMKPYEVLCVTGERTPMLVAPDGGEFPDQRLAYPVTPPWAIPLLPLEESAAQQPTSEGLRNGRYEVHEALSFSSAGGVYRGTDRFTGKTVVIKEARPYINATTDGNDAIQLLKKEHRILTLLKETGVAPKPIDFFSEWEHCFLVEEYIEGISLAAHSAENNILLRTKPAPEDYREWYRTFRSLCISIATAVQVLQSRGIVFSDLSSNNLIVLTGKAEVKLIDFEGASEIGVDHPSAIYTPGFISQDRLAGSEAVFEDDWYSIGAVLMAYLLPITQLFHLNPEAKYEIMPCIQRDTGLPDSIARMILALMEGDTKRRPTPAAMLDVLEAAPEVVQSGLPSPAVREYGPILDGIVAHLTDAAACSRQDRLFPSDPRLFVTNPLSLAYGASGIVYALTKITGQPQEAAVSWILRHKLVPEAYPPGLYLGVSGIAWSLLEIGRRQQAEQTFQLAFQHRLLYQAPDLFYGIAGWGLTTLRFFLETGNQFYLEKAMQAGKRLLELRHETGSGCYWDTLDELQLGLAHGSSGIALFLLYLYLATGDEQYVEVGEQALAFDLSFATRTKDGGLSWRQAVHTPSALYPYWRFGSAGIGTAVLRYFRLLGKNNYWSILQEICIDTNRKYAVFPGRFLGLTGLGDFFLDMYDLTGADEYLVSARKVADGIMAFRVEHHGIAFPGESLSRICCDYGTGSAGIALFFNRLLGRQKGDFMLDSFFVHAGKQPVKEQSNSRLGH